MNCTYCGKENPSEQKYCEECGLLLQEAAYVPLAQPAPEATRKPAEQQSGQVLCPDPKCRQVNLAGTSFCTICGADLANAEPVQQDTSKAKVKLLLADNNEIPVAGNSVTIGRNDFERLIDAKDLPYVSRKHFIISHDEEDYFIEDCNSGNGTMLNGEQIKTLGKKKLNDGDSIGILDVVTVTFKRT
jgi:hypothetical protein